MRFSIRHRYWIYMITLLILPMTLMGHFFMTIFNNTMLERLKNEQNRMFQTLTNNSIDHGIEHYSRALDVFRKDERLSQLFEDQEKGQGLLREWGNIGRILDADIDIYYGDNRGRYISSRGYSAPPSGVQVTPWYRAGLEHQGIFWTEPYISEKNGRLVISGVCQVEGSDSGVLGLDFELSSILTSFKEFSYGTESKLLALTSRWRVINFNRRPSEPVEFSSLYEWKNVVVSDEEEQMINLDGTEYYVFSVYIEKARMYLVSLFPKAAIVDEIRPFLPTVFSIIIISTLFMLAGSLLMSSRTIHDINSLNTYMADVADGNYTLKTCVRGSDEFLTLNRYLNDMVDTLSGNIIELAGMNSQKEHLIEVRTTLLHIISHSASTPVPVLINSSMELMEGDEENEEFRQMFAASENLKSILENTMIYLKLEEGFAEARQQLLDLGGITKMICDNYASRLKEKQLKLDIELKESYIHGHYFLTRTVIENLIDNAVKYSLTGGRVKISGEYKDDFFEWRIEDGGPGFSPEDRKELFHKFKKLSARPTGGESSTGLGLYLVKKIMQTFNGEIILEPDRLSGSGAVFTLLFPLAYGEETETLSYESPRSAVSAGC